MEGYPDLITRTLLQPGLLGKLCPSEPASYDLLHKVREAKPEAFTDGLPLAKGAQVEVLRGGLYYALDAIEPAHRIFQDDPSDLGSYWHGMMHRREGDFDNARYWFRRSGRLPFFPRLHRAAGQHHAVIMRQSDWDPYLFTGECEQARHGAETEKELAKVQLAEFEVIFDYLWRQTVVNPAGAV